MSDKLPLRDQIFVWRWRRCLLQVRQNLAPPIAQRRPSSRRRPAAVDAAPVDRPLSPPSGSRPDRVRSVPSLKIKTNISTFQKVEPFRFLETMISVYDYLLRKFIIGFYIINKKWIKKITVSRSSYFYTIHKVIVQRTHT